MKTVSLLVLFLAATAMAQDDVHFTSTIEANIKLSLDSTKCYDAYLFAPISSVVHQNGDSLPMGLPSGIWITTGSDNCENLRQQLSQQSSETTVSFEIKGGSYWQTNRIGGGCTPQKCQSYETYAELNGRFQNYEVRDIYSHEVWDGYAPDVVTTPTPAHPRPQRHSNCSRSPRIIICED